MNLKSSVTYARYGLTAGITALSALYPLYPHWTWITPVIVAAASVGIHAVPSISQQNTNEAPQANPTDHVG